MKAIGVDGCRAGWIAVSIEEEDFRVELYPRFDPIGQLAIDGASTVWIDIPIGLPDRRVPRRPCDRLARQLLGPNKAASVFPPPGRGVLRARSYREACGRNHRITGSMISKQTWNILPKISEVDFFLRKNPAARNRVYESHPELCFLGFGGSDLPGKKTRGGEKARLDILGRWLKNPAKAVETARDRFGRKNVAADDVTDAMILAISCSLVGHPMVHLPPEPDSDRAGLQRQIVFRRINPPA